ncbi:uncharacterized protein LOC108158737 [Drosophila miranda]|uniref:uncharacterized protein LOC108158737 n=1 Tax=Drosophila miranda TaxID=7229 RepID=UPI0007E5C43E|nr:uncharacterized protein LOC108158737 [Drosophila miranda]XP_017146833.1 uncharacterized protein LOC108158737 [Drosophila miranda]
MEFLPDADLISIFGLLDLKSQLNMAKVHSRFYSLMPLVWGSKVSLSLFELEISSGDLRHYLSIIRTKLQVLRLNMINRESFEILTSYVFPNAHDFRFSTQSFHLKDADILMIIKAFPQLRTFSPVGHFTGKYFADIPHLENLRITYCGGFEGNNLVHIMQAKQLKTLNLDLFGCDEDILDIELPTDGMKSIEVLICDEEEFSIWFMNNLKHLKNLKQLTIRGKNYPSKLLDIAEKLKAVGRHRLKQLEVHNACNSYFDAERLQLDVETFVLNYVKNLFPSRCNITHPFRHIKRLLFYSCNIEDADCFGHFLQLCRHVEVIAFEDCSFGFQHYTFSAPRIARHRATALNMYLEGTTFVKHFEDGAPMTWSVEGEDRLFKLHLTKSKIHCVGQRNISINFYPAETEI